MYINADEFLKHVNDSKNVAYFKGAPSFNLEEREEGEITIRVSGVRNDSYVTAVKNAIAILQSLHDTCMAAMFAGGEAVVIHPINSIENIYLYVDSEKRSISFKDHVYMVTLPFVGAKGFAKFITGLAGKCIEIKYDKALEKAMAECNYVEDEDEKQTHRKVKSLVDTTPFVREKDELPIGGVIIKYHSRRFRRTEDLVEFLNYKNLAPEDIIDIEHKLFSHVLIYCYKKEVR